MITRADAEKLDRHDPLAPARERFHIPSDTLVYLDGNSLGMPPRRTLDRLTDLFERGWATDLIRSWDHWAELPQVVGDLLAPLIGAREGEVVVHDSTTVNLYQLVHAAMALRPHRRVLAIDPHDFPTDRYVVDGIARANGNLVRHDLDDLTDVGVVVRSAVDYRTGALTDLVDETRRIHGAGALVVWDLSHAAGALQIDLAAAGAQFAVGCTYKYLNGGPGAPAFSYVAKDLHRHLDGPLRGWFGAAEKFAMAPDYEPALDIGRLLLGTPGILGLVAARSGIELTAEFGMFVIERKGRELTALAIDLCDQYGLTTPTPRESYRRGHHISIVHPDARQIVRTLSSRNVVLDHREPDLVRVGCSALTTRFVDVFDGITAIAELAKS